MSYYLLLSTTYCLLPERDAAMRFDFYGLAFEAPSVVFHLWSPWRATALEHRLFDALRNLPRGELEEGADEHRLGVTDPKTFRTALQAVSMISSGSSALALQDLLQRFDLPDLRVIIDDVLAHRAGVLLKERGDVELHDSASLLGIPQPTGRTAEKSISPGGMTQPSDVL